LGILAWPGRRRSLALKVNPSLLYRCKAAVLTTAVASTEAALKRSVGLRAAPAADALPACIGNNGGVVRACTGLPFTGHRWSGDR